MDTYKITLTGTQDPVSLDDLGIDPIAYNPPSSTDFDLIAGYGLDPEEISESVDFRNAIENGWMTAKTPDGTTLNSSNIVDFVDSLNTSSLTLDNLDATTNPTINDDDTKGYSIGSLWINVSTDASFRCMDNTTGSAVWADESNEDLEWNSILNKPSVFPPEDHTTSVITDFDTAVSANTDVDANSTHRGLTNNPHATTASQVGIDDTDDINEGTNNKYYTETRVSNNSDVSANTNHRGLTNNPHSTTASQVGINDSDDISEGSSNLYFTDTRVNNNSNVSANTTHRGLTNNPHSVTKTQVGINSTDDINEGSNNKYYTEARVSANASVALNTTHRGRTNNPHSVTKTQIGLGNVTNVAQIPLSQKGVANGVATLDGTGKIPTGQLPAFVDDVLEYANLASFPTTGESGKIYIALDTGKTYRWSGSAYTEISSGDVNSVNGETGVVVLDADDINEGSTNLYYTETRVSNNSDVNDNTTHRGRTDNPHSTTASQVGIDDSDDISEGSANLYFTNTRVANAPAVQDNTTHRNTTGNPHSTTPADIGINDTDDINEGTSNLYHTEGRVSANTNVSANTTHRGRTDNPHSTTASQIGIDDSDDVSEGSTNLYYTETRVSNNANVSDNTTHRGRTDNPHSTSKTQVGLGNVDNVQQIPLSEKGANNGVAELDGTGKIPTAQLPTLVDELNDLSDVQITNPQDGEVLIREGGVFKNLSITSGNNNSTKDINQAGHGYTIVGNIPIPVYIDNSGLFQKAIANNDEKLHVSFIVKITDNNNFVIQQSGYINATSHGLMIGHYYYLSDTVIGEVTDVAPSDKLDDVCFYVIDTNTLLLIDNRPFDRNSLEKWIIKCSNTEFGTVNINPSSGTVEVPLTGNVNLNENGYYTVVGNGVQVPETRAYKVSVNIHVTSNDNRTNQRIRLAINGVPTGPISASGYIRNSSGHNESSYHLTDVLFLSVDDIITVVSEEEASSGDVYLAEVGTSTIILEAR